MNKTIKKKKGPSKWITFVKQKQKELKLSYRDTMKNKGVREEWKKIKGGTYH